MLDVIADNATCWNHVFCMLKRLQTLMLPMSIVLNDPTVSKASDQALNLSGSLWDQVRSLSDVLERFRAVIISFSSTKNITISTILPVMVELRGERRF